MNSSQIQALKQAQAVLCALTFKDTSITNALSAIHSALEADAKSVDFTPAMIEAIWSAWHGAGVDIAGGDWKRFVGMLDTRSIY